ncbi:hypothetical protein Gpo141_00015152, partial [Globisporangium polare]
AGAAMNEVLVPWELYDLAGAEDPAPVTLMRTYFVRYREVHQKRMYGVDGVALQRSWCSFVYRWNQEQRRGGFREWLEGAELKLRRHGLGALRLAACDVAWRSGSPCLVDAMEGCPRCAANTRRLTYAEWLEAVTDHAFDDEALSDFGR